MRLKGVVHREEDGEGDLPRLEGLGQLPTFLSAEIAIVDPDRPVRAAMSTMPDFQLTTHHPALPRQVIDSVVRPPGIIATSVSPFHVKTGR